VLRRADIAHQEGNQVHALVRGIAVNQGGASGGLTVPNGPAQVKVCRALPSPLLP
jgi:acyl transferase domain-containing protein